MMIRKSVLFKILGYPIFVCEVKFVDLWTKG